MKVRNIFGSRFSGTLGKDLVASSWKGKEYLREYVVPTDPKTVRQLEHRQIWREAVAAWRALPDAERRAYDREAKGMTGFNLFVGRYVRGRRAGTVPHRTLNESVLVRDCDDSREPKAKTGEHDPSSLNRPGGPR